MKDWQCPKCGKPVRTINHPSVIVYHRCRPAIPRAVRLVQVQVPQQQEETPK